MRADVRYTVAFEPAMRPQVQSARGVEDARGGRERERTDVSTTVDLTLDLTMDLTMDQGKHGVQK